MPIEIDNIIDDITYYAKLEQRVAFVIASISAIVLYLLGFSFWWFPSIMIMLNILIYFERRCHKSLVIIENQLDEIYDKK